MRTILWFVPFLALSLLTLTACNGTRGIDLQSCNSPAGTGFITKTLQQPDHSRSYAVFIPHNYNTNEKYPVIIFLHGLGEAGSDCQSILSVGLAPFVAENAATFNFIVIFPQSTGGWNENSKATVDAIATLDQVQKDYSIDLDRVVLTGLSTGGYGTWAIGSKYKQRFAALVPMCAFSDEKDIPNLTDIPIWSFHNSGDFFPSSSGSARMCSKITALGGKVKYTQYETRGHNCWDAAYATPELFIWMAAQRRNTSIAAPTNPNKTSTNVTPAQTAPAVKIPTKPTPPV